MINRNDLVVYRGKIWRCDYVDEVISEGLGGGRYKVLGISNNEGDHMEIHYNAVKPLESYFAEKAIGDVLP
jgi:hypothetical protein